MVIPYAPKNYLESSTGRDRLKRCDTKRLDSRACSAPPFAYSIPRREKTEEKGGQGTRRRKGRVDPTASGRSPLTDGVVEWVMVEWVAGGSGGLDGDTRGACGRAPPWCGACASLVPRSPSFPNRKNGLIIVQVSGLSLILIHVYANWLENILKHK